MAGLRGTGTINVRLIRTALGLTQAQMGVFIGVTPDSVYRWEAGRAISPIARQLLHAFVAKREVMATLLEEMGREELSLALGQGAAAQTHSA